MGRELLDHDEGLLRRHDHANNLLDAGFGYANAALRVFSE